MEMYIYIFLYVIIEAMIIWIWEWREKVRWGRNVFRKTRTISWIKRRLLKMKRRRKRRIRKSKILHRQRMILLSYLRYLQKIKLDETTGQDLLANENDINNDLANPKDCSTPWGNSKSTNPDAIVKSLDIDSPKSCNPVITVNFSSDVTQDEPVAGSIIDMDLVIDDVKATLDKIHSIVCETPVKEESTEKVHSDSATDQVKEIIDGLLSIVCTTPYKTSVDKTVVENNNPNVEDQAKKVDAEKAVTVDSNNQEEVIITEPINRPFLFDPDLAATNTVSKPSGPRRLIHWTDFDVVTLDDDVLTGNDVQSWDCEDMFEYNEIHFGYKSSLDKDLSEYTTPLIREDTEEYRLRWERACRLAEEIKTKRLADQATQVSKKKRNKKAKGRNIAILS